MASQCTSEILIMIPRVPPGGNELRRKYRHWAAYRMLKQTWERELAVNSQGLQRAYLYACHSRQAKMHVRFDIGRKRLLDQDNAIAGLKPVLDAMRAVKFIYQDSPRYLELDVAQHNVAEELTEIRINPIEATKAAGV